MRQKVRDSKKEGEEREGEKVRERKGVVGERRGERY